jgi:hypothetical protein
MPKSLLAATMLSGVHVGARPAITLRIDTDDITPCQCSPSERSSERSVRSDWNPAIQLRDGQYLRDLGDDWYEVWTGDSPPAEARDVNPLLAHVDIEVALPSSTPISLILEARRRPRSRVTLSFATASHASRGCATSGATTTARSRRI